MDYEQAYQLVKSNDGKLESLLPKKGEPLTEVDVNHLRLLCEMILVRVYDDWYTGKPDSNVSKAIHAHVEKLTAKEKRPISMIRRVGALLAWCYVQQDHDSDDAYLLLTHVLEHIRNNDDGRTLPPPVVPSMKTMLERWREDRGVPPSLEALTDREREVWDEIMRWEIDPKSSLDDMKERLEVAKGRVIDAVPEAVMRTISDALEGGLRFLQDSSEWLVREKALLDEVREKGYEVGEIRDLRKVPLETLDRIARATAAGGKILAGLEGAGTGAGGPLFIAADIPALMMINFRYISQIASTYGFPVQSREEQAFMLHLIGFSSADRASKTIFLREMNQIAMGVARRRTWEELNRSALVQLIRKIAEFLGVRLTKQKLAQLIPIVGAAVGGGVNYAFTHDNLTAAMMMYRKRHLIQKCVA